MSTLQNHAARLLENIDAAERERRDGRLSPEDRALILRLGAKGTLSQEDIARAVGCHQSSVSRLLALANTTVEARMILEAGAARLASTVIKTDDAAVALKALSKVGVVADDRAVPGGGVTIIVGTPGAPVRLPDFSCQTGALPPATMAPDMRAALIAALQAAAAGAFEPKFVRVRISARRERRVRRPGMASPVSPTEAQAMCAFYWFEGCSVTEIGRRFHRTRSTVRKALNNPRALVPAAD